MARIPRLVSDSTKRARKLREQQTKAESLLWNVVRANRLCGLKFRRQYPIGPFYADFACVSRKLIVELDGGYHDYQVEDDLARQQFLEEQGWQVLRYTNEDVLEDVEVVAIGIATQLGLEANFGERKRATSGMMSPNKPSPGRYRARTSPRGRGDG